MSNVIFVTKVRTSEGKKFASRLIQSIRTFGGELSSSPFWVFTVSSTKLPCCDDLKNGTTEIIPLNVPDHLLRYDLGDKVYVCSKAEEFAPGDTHTLIWIDPTCLVVNPPVLYALNKETDVAVRPVHIRNVGLGISQPLDAYWKGIYEMAGVRDIQVPVESFVDRQAIRAYFNTHAFAIDPRKGLLHRWLANFEKLVCDDAFQTGACSDELHQVFLHQAVLSVLITSSVAPDRIRLLPPQYNYPYNLHASLAPERRAQSLNDLVSFTYEDRDLAMIDDIEVHEPLRAWLANGIGAGSGQG